jgi:hypothetical protein
MALKRDPYTGPKERVRMGGERREPGPGGGMPGARDMDRPSGDASASSRHGDGTVSVPRGIRTIQDQNGNGGRR